MTITLLDKPMVVKNTLNLGDVAQKIGTDFAESKTSAKIWETGAKFAGQEVSLKTKVQDGMKIKFI